MLAFICTGADGVWFGRGWVYVVFLEYRCVALLGFVYVRVFLS